MATPYSLRSPSQLSSPRATNYELGPLSRAFIKNCVEESRSQVLLKENNRWARIMASHYDRNLSSTGRSHPAMTNILTNNARFVSLIATMPCLLRVTHRSRRLFPIFFLPFSAFSPFSANNLPRQDPVFVSAQIVFGWTHGSPETTFSGENFQMVSNRFKRWKSM